MSKCRKLFIALSVTLLLTVVGLYYVWHNTYSLPLSIVSGLRHYARIFHNIDFTVKELKLNLRENYIDASELKIMVPDQEPFASIENMRGYLASDTGIQDLFYKNFLVYKFDIEKLFININASYPISAPHSMGKINIPISIVKLNGLKLDTSVTSIDIPDFRGDFARADNNATLNFYFSNSVISGTGQFIAMLNMDNGDAKVRLLWEQKDFSGFLPLIFLWHFHGLNVTQGSAEADLRWQGNVFSRLRDREKFGDLFNKELQGQISLKNCLFNIEKTPFILNIDAHRNDSEPWNIITDCKNNNSKIILNTTYKGTDEKISDFETSFSLDSLDLSIFPEKVIKSLNLYVPDLEIGTIDMNGKLTGKDFKISGEWSSTARNLKYKNWKINTLDMLWNLTDSSDLSFSNHIETDFGNIDATVTLSLSGENKKVGELYGNIERADLQIIEKKMGIPISGTSYGTIKAFFDLDDLKNIRYDADLYFDNVSAYRFESEHMHGRIYGKGAEWNIINPSATFTNNGFIDIEGIISHQNIKAKAIVNQVNLKNFSVSDTIASGCINLDTELSGTLLSPVVKGSLFVQDALVKGTVAKTIRADILVEDNKLILAPLVLRTENNADVDGFIGIDLSSGRLQSLKLNFQKLDATEFRNFLPSRFSIRPTKGIMNGNIEYDINRGAAHWNIFLDARNVNIMDHHLETLYFEGSIFDKQAEVKTLFIRAFRGNLSMHGQMLDYDNFSGSLEADSIFFQEIPLLQNYLPELKGELSFQGDLAWDKNIKNGNFSIFAKKMNIAGQDLGNFGGEVALDNLGMKVTSGEFDKLGIKIDGEIDWTGKKPYKAELLLDNTDLSFISRSHGISMFNHGGIVISGYCSIQGDLDTATPDIIDVVFDDVHIQKEDDIIVANKPVRILYQNGGVEIRSLELKYRLGILGMQGIYTPGKPLSMMVNADDFSLKALGRLLNLPNWNYDGNLSINARVFGKIDAPELRAEARIDNLTISDRKIPLVDAKIEGNGEEIKIENLHVTLPDSSLNLNGTISLDQSFLPKKLNLQLEIPESPLLDLPRYFPNIFREAIGSISANIDISGKSSNPQIVGDFKFDADFLQLSNMKAPIRDVNISVTTKDKLVNIDTLQAQIGRGKLHGFGHIDFNTELGSLYAGIRGEMLDIGFDKLNMSGASVTIDIAGDFYNPEITGKVYIPRGRLNLTSEMLAKKKAVNSIFDTLKYRFEVKAPRNFWVRNTFLNAEMKGEFVLSGDLDNFKLDGEVSCVRGNIMFQGRKFKIDTGEIKFGGIENNLDPHIYLKSEGEVQSTRIFLTLQGYVSSFTPQIYSSPPMSESSLLSMLAFGRDLSGATNNDTKDLFENEILEGLKNTYISALIGNPISEALNLDELFLGSLFDRDSGNTKTYIRVGKYIGHNIFMAYEGTMDEEDDATYIFEYLLPKDFVINLEFNEPEKEYIAGVRYDWKF